ncbi:hypothetical protein GQ600_17019 [Phytophthora cactorum]|nr:hypothetical protein GQ600_17019 [Phytophthora cactorum]
MAFTNEKRWPAGFRPDPMEEKPPAMNFMAAWPTSSAANFSRLAQEPGSRWYTTRCLPRLKQ